MNFVFVFVWDKFLCCSKNALICLRNGSFYLCCRIGDLRCVMSYNIWKLQSSKKAADFLLIFNWNEERGIIDQPYSYWYDNDWMIWVIVKGHGMPFDQDLLFSGQHIFWNHMYQDRWWSGKWLKRERWN